MKKPAVGIFHNSSLESEHPVVEVNHYSNSNNVYENSLVFNYILMDAFKKECKLAGIGEKEHRGVNTILKRGGFMSKKLAWIKMLKQKWKKFHLNQVFLLTFSTVFLGIIIFFYYLANTVEVSALEKGFSQSTIIYDKNGEVASKISANKTESVLYNQIPKHVIDAVVSIEDHRFFEHNGVDFKGILRAFVRNTKAGEIVEGGSTITQQLTKTALLSSERTYRRKIDEVF
ncbi:MAG TPA: biosynthetic peptidoglycan transglycosylase, partial [Pseudoneobacillus sp.]|nr:biosynthetic peptidoglycan transglycosylase [Pseudoneobacillus sp.]